MKQYQTYMDEIHKKRMLEESVLQGLIAEVKKYCEAKKDVQLVFNRLEECLKQGYFFIYANNRHTPVYLEDIGISEYTARIVA